MKTAPATLVLVAALLAFAGSGSEWGGGGVSLAQTSDPPPSCTNGDCSPPSCTNGDCTPPECTNGDCPPPEARDCCCVGDNQPGDIRVCCCRSTTTLATVTCRESLVLETGYPDNWHQTLAQETLDGKRPKSCDTLESFCNRPVKEVCAKQKGKNCPALVMAVCRIAEKVCLYRYCGPEWFPYAEPAPDLASCEWWNQIHACRFR